MTWPEVLNWEQAEAYLRRNWQNAAHRGARGGVLADRPWPEVRLAFRFGWEWGRNTRFTGYDFEAAEADLKRFWDVNRPLNAEWDEVRQFVLIGWQRARNESWGHNWRRVTW